MKIYKISFLSNNIRSLILFFFFPALLQSCSNKNYSSQSQYQFTNTTAVPDYSRLEYWAAHPWKKDPSDSIPAPLRNGHVADSTVDVFFIHPTTLTSKNDNRWNADINDAKLNAETDYSTILYQASVFNEDCRVFAPRYRQANLKAFFIEDSIAAPYFDIAYEDVKNAFEYYLSHYNAGRPIIIASHSQGTRHAARLLKEYFENKLLYNKLVCAYIIGMPVPENYLTGIPVCDNPNKTGCIVSWRTFKSGYEGPDYVTKEKNKIVVVNPLTWTTTEAYASEDLNKGGVLRRFNRVIPGVVSAQVHGNILWTSKPDMPGKILLVQKNYHIGDINLFYVNIRENVKARIAAFWKR
jgi:hypothetical protein